MCSKEERFNEYGILFVCVVGGRGAAGCGSDFETGGPWEVALGSSSSHLPRCTLIGGKLSGGQLGWGPAPRKEICPQAPQGPLRFPQTREGMSALLGLHQELRRVWPCPPPPHSPLPPLPAGQLSQRSEHKGATRSRPFRSHMMDNGE